MFVFRRPIRDFPRFAKLKGLDGEWGTWRGSKVSWWFFAGGGLDWNWKLKVFTIRPDTPGRTSSKLLDESGEERERAIIRLPDATQKELRTKSRPPKFHCKSKKGRHVR